MPRMNSSLADDGLEEPHPLHEYEGEPYRRELALVLARLRGDD